MDAVTLLERCRNNDEKAWTYAYNYIICWVRDHYNTMPPDIVQDISRDTILYWLNRGIDDTQIEQEKAFKRLLTMKASCIAIDLIRKTQRLAEVPLTVSDRESGSEILNPDIEPVYPTVMEKVYYEQVLMVIKNALMKNKPTCWPTLIRYFEAKASGEKLRDVAREFEMEPNAFSTRVSRCFSYLATLPEYRTMLEEFKPG